MVKTKEFVTINKGETTDLGYTELYDVWVPELDDYLNKLLRELETEDSIGEFVKVGIEFEFTTFTEEFRFTNEEWMTKPVKELFLEEFKCNLNYDMDHYAERYTKRFKDHNINWNIHEYELTTKGVVITFKLSKLNSNISIPRISIHEHGLHLETFRDKFNESIDTLSAITDIHTLKNVLETNVVMWGFGVLSDDVLGSIKEYRIESHLNKSLLQFVRNSLIAKHSHFVKQILTENGIRLEELNLTVKVENITDGSYTVRVMTSPK